MTNAIIDTVITLLPNKRKSNATGWYSFNAPCCVHNGETRDVRGRGGFIFTQSGGVNFHCFNCQYKTGWEPGKHLPYKFRKLLQWLGGDSATIQRLVIEALRIKDTIDPTEEDKAREEYVVKARPLPQDAMSIAELTSFYALKDWQDCEQFTKALTYLAKRKVDLQQYQFFLTNDTQSNLHKRIIIPIYWKGQVVGYTGRAFDDTVKPKYLNNYENNVLFNFDNQKRDSKFVLVHEGPFDAMAVDGIALMGTNITDAQVDLIESLGKEVIVVPDFELKEVRGKKVWTGERLIELALEFGWSVSYPIWKDLCKDASKAVEVYGKLYTLKAILDGKESKPLKIELLKKRIHTT